jgi:sulfoxide reductase heme-binding subunit YedZ
MSNAVWYLMRGTGVTSLLLLTGVVTLGILTARKSSLPTLPRFATMTLHRSISLLAVVFLVIHVTSAVIDPYAQVRLVDSMVPFAGSWRPLWLGLGTLSLDVLAAVIISSLLMKRIGRRIWRTIHWLGYATWPLAFLHSLGTGSDSGTLWLRALSIGMFATICAALYWRLDAASGMAQREPARRMNTLSSAARKPTASAPVSAAASPRLETSSVGG